jgi:hypothetical protein
MRIYKSDLYKIYPLIDPESENDRVGGHWIWRNLNKGSIYIDACKQIHDLRSKQFNRIINDTRNNSYSSSRD